MDFTGKVAVVTGGAQGIGRATALALAARGAWVSVVDRDVSGGEETLRLIVGAGGSGQFQPADVSLAQDVRAYVEAALAHNGQIDAFFNNAGIEGVLAPIHELDEAVFDQVVAVNLRGAFLGLRHVLSVMVQQRSGAVINTASLGGLRGAPNLAPYIASKHGVLGLTKSAAADVGRFGVRVNAVCPGPIATRMMGSIDAQRRLLSVDAPPAHSATYGTAEDVANLVIFLLSDLAGNITGSSFTVDGGRSAFPGPVALA
jgi:NAD(P)-dependent dehydrogenase (short-subunit alcohol dehydrogenase family)